MILFGQLESSSSSNYNLYAGRLALALLETVRTVEESEPDGPKSFSFSRWTKILMGLVSYYSDKLWKLKGEEDNIVQEWSNLLRCYRSIPSDMLLRLYETPDMFQRERKRRKAKLRSFVRHVYEASCLTKEGFHNTLDVLEEGENIISSSQTNFPPVAVDVVHDDDGAADGGGDGGGGGGGDDNKIAEEVIDASTYVKTLERLKNKAEMVQMI